MLALGVIIASVPAGYVGDRFGPKKCMVYFVLPTIIFTIMVVFAKDSYLLCAGRFIAGLTVGGLSVLAPVYLAEIADVSNRVCLGPISCGVNLGWTSPVLPQLENNNFTLPVNLTVSEGSWVGSMLALGVVVASVPAGYLGDRFGPKKCMVYFALPTLIFTVMVVFAQDAYLLCAGRFMAGLAVGGLSALAPVYLAEIADVSNRGNLVSSFEFQLYAGILLVSVCGAYIQYRTLTVLFAIFTALIGIALLFFPESPVYLLRKNQRVKAMNALKFYRSDQFDVQEAIDYMQNSQQSKSKANITETLISKPVTRGLIACCGLTAFQQLSGIDCIVFYNVQILQAADTNMNAYNLAIILSLIQFFSNFIIVFFAEKAPRRVLMSCSAAVCAFSLFVLGFYFHFKQYNYHFIGSHHTPVICLTIYLIGFGFGLSSIPLIINGELFPNTVKGLAGGIITLVHWLLLFFNTKTFPSVMESSGAQYPFYFYGFFCLGPISCGVNLGWTSPVLPQLENNNFTLPVTLTVSEGSWVGSMLALGVVVASVPAGYLGDLFGPKKCMVYFVVPTLIFTIMVVFARDVYLLCAGRFMAGLAVGGISALAPVYLAEIAEVSNRGNLISSFEFQMYAGVLLVSVCGAYLHYLVLSVFFSVFTALIGITLLFFPESPVYLLRTNHREKAINALQFYRSKEFNVEKAIDYMQNSLQSKSKVNIAKTLISKPVTRGLVACCGLTAFQQFTGVDCIIFYSVQILQAADTSMNAYALAIILSVIQFFSTFIGVCLAEKAPRRDLMHFSAAVCGFSSFVLGFYFHFKRYNYHFIGVEKSISIMNCKNTELTAKLRQFIATICLGPISFGASLSWTSPVLPQLQNQNSTLPFTLSIAEGSWVGSMLAVGVLCTAIPSGYLADRIGLKRCIIGLALPNVIFTIIVFFSEDVYSLCIARFISGIAGGGVSVLSPIYIADISDVSLRGVLGCFFELLIYVGIILVSTFGAYFHYITLTIVVGVSSLLFGIIFLVFPESPTYLIKIGLKDDAKTALEFFRSEGNDVSQDLEQICRNLQEQQELQKVNIKKALTSKPVIRGLIACVGLTVFQQLCAVDAIVFYTVQIFQETDTGIDAYTSAIILSVVQLLSALFTVFIIEKAGRRLFLYVSTIGCGIPLCIVGVYFDLKVRNISFTGIDYVPLVSLLVFALGFALGLGPVPWLINGELFSHEVKGVANGITITSNWIMLFVVTKTFPIAMKDVGPQFPFYLYASFMVLCLVFVKFCVPETRGKSLEQIQNELKS
ncbi:hypothetical protein RN001_013787 [Aquatica leii]|uniref:Major facilitator superfamily (MFS) profile domain-containing protein n=1 Tax=Aquatica leii TaxID=1421715 RepID=A0AAN7SCJ6_9COLE|nr:hypothetical protein RN001_013787 [Aquatica leii]